MKFHVVEISDGNLRNDHLYLASVLHLFPPEIIGGSNDDDLAQEVEIQCGIGEPVFTDIAGDKKIFRRRAWVREFFSAHGLKAGDRVVIEQTGPRRFHVYPQRLSGL